jgi:hypothetical protein
MLIVRLEKSAYKFLPDHDTVDLQNNLISTYKGSGHPYRLNIKLGFNYQDAVFL